MPSQLWVAAHAARYARLKPVYLGDDLFSRQPICQAVLDTGGHFLFVCQSCSSASRIRARRSKNTAQASPWTSEPKRSGAARSGRHTDTNGSATCRRVATPAR